MNKVDTDFVNSSPNQNLQEFLNSINASLFNHNPHHFFLTSRISNIQMNYLLNNNFKDIKRFNITNMNFDHTAIKMISKPSWQNLLILELSDNLLGPKGSKYLSKGDWPKLEELIMGKNKIQNVGLHYLSKASWKNLKLVILNDNLIDGQGVGHLLQVNWKQVEVLNLERNSLSVAGIMSLMRLQMEEMHWLQLKNQRQLVVSLKWKVIPKKFPKLDLRELTF